MDAGTIISIIAVVVAFAGFLLNSRKDTRSDAAANAIVQAKLDSLINGVDDIRVEMRSTRDTVGEHGERLAKVEARAANMEHRLDIVEGKTKIGG